MFTFICFIRLTQEKGSRGTLVLRLVAVLSELKKNVCVLLIVN